MCQKIIFTQVFLKIVIFDFILSPWSLVLLRLCAKRPQLKISFLVRRGWSVIAIELRPAWFGPATLTSRTSGRRRVERDRSGANRVYEVRRITVEGEQLLVDIDSGAN